MRVLWSGEWDFEVRRDGVLLAPTSEWVEVCWDSDDDADYLELEIDLGAGVRMQRAFFLGKEDSVVFLSDTILDELRRTRHTFEYRGRLPTTDQTFFEGSGGIERGPFEARQGSRNAGPSPGVARVERNGRTRIRFPEKRHPEGLSLEPYGLRRLRGRRSALFFDLDGKRLGKPFTWRHLTVAETLEVQPKDRAGCMASSGR